MAANAAQDFVRVLEEGDAPRDVTAVPLNRIRKSPNPAVSSRSVRTAMKQEQFEGE